MLGRSAVVSDTGRRRRHNEDQYVCLPPLFAVADGMGGAQAGEIASGLAAAVLNEAAPDGSSDERGEERVAWLIKEANRRVYQRSSEDEATSGMGTTMTVALVDGDTIAFGHVGDSRAYRVRDGELEQLTDDHSLVGELVRSGRLSLEEAESHPQRSVITRALGTEADVDVDTFTVEGQPGDVYLLCSDGLTDMVPGRELQALLGERIDDLDATARALVDAANAGGGEDNITVVLFQISADRAAEVTVQSRAVATPEPEAKEEAKEDDEDTLSGLEPVPAVDTAVISPADVDEQLQQLEPEPAPASPTKPGRRLAPLLLLVALLGVIAVLVFWGLTR